jgi:hypothetical protein
LKIALKRKIIPAQIWPKEAPRILHSKNANTIFWRVKLRLTSVTVIRVTDMQTLTLCKHQRQDCDREYWALFLDGELLASYNTFDSAQDAFIGVARYMTD